MMSAFLIFTRGLAHRFRLLSFSNPALILRGEIGVPVTARRFSSLIFLLVAALFGCNAGRIGKNSDTIPIPEPSKNAETSPIPTHDWPVPELESSIDLTRSDLNGISANLGIDLASGQDSFFSVDNSDVRLNEIQPQNQNDLIPLFESLFSSVGDINSILLGGDRVYEIISDNPYAAEAVRHSLDLTQIQKLKLTPHQAYGELTLTRDDVIGFDELGPISERLGFEIAGLINQEVLLDGSTCKVNFIEPADGISPLDARDKLISSKNSDIGVYAVNNTVVEIVTDRWDIAEKIWRVINIPPPPRTDIYRYRVRFSAIPVKNADYMKINSLYNLLTEGVKPSDLLEYDPTLEFGDSFPLFICDGRTIVDCSPEIKLDPVDSSISIGTVVIPEDSIGKPVEVSFDLYVKTNRAYEKGPEDIVRYVSATPFWPVNSDTARSALEEVRGEYPSDTTVGLIRGLNSWVRDNIEYSGDVVGSRYGVETVFEQRYGHCWDLSDVYVTLARTAGLPAREVAGWIYGVGGHVWAQVWLDEQNAWVDVDPTRDHVGVTSLYIPIWGTIDGEMLFLYSSTPEIYRLGF